MSFELLLLVCLASTPSDQCTEGTALHVLKDHRDFGSPMDCFAFGAHRAIPLIKGAGEDAYFKVKCKPEHDT